MILQLLQRRRQRQRLRALLLSCALACCIAHPVLYVQAAQGREKNAVQGAARASSRRAAPAPQARSQAKQKAGGAKSAQQQQRRNRQQAIAALLETADAARAFDDPFYKITIQASVAGEIWPFDEPSARAILARAWEATIAPGAVEAMRVEDEPAEAARENVEAAQRTIIEQAAKHDTRLAESLLEQQHSLEKLSDENPSRNDSTETANAPQAETRRQLGNDARQRLQIAYTLLRSGEYERAAGIAAPLMRAGVSSDLLEFIYALRAKEERAADNLYLSLLEHTRADVGADANDVLLLSTPVVSPLLYVFIDRDGAARFFQRQTASINPARATSPLPVAARRAFFNTAANVLLRLPLAREADAQANHRTAALYFTIGRLLPFFAREAPQHLSALQARQAALNAEIEAARREFLSASMNISSMARKNPSDPLGPSLEALARATDANSRDQLRFNIVMRAATLKLWERARRVADGIEDSETQSGARRLITLYQIMTLSEAYGDTEEDDFERAASFARSADVPAEARATGLALAAQLAARRRKQTRALELLDEAAVLAGQTPQKTKQRAAAYAMLTLAAARIDPARATEVFAAFIGAANGAGDSLAYELSFEFEVAMPGGQATIFLPGEPFRLAEVFATMARLDFTRTLSEVRALEDDVTRAEATLAAARTVLHQPRERRKSV